MPLEHITTQPSNVAKPPVYTREQLPPIYLKHVYQQSENIMGTRRLKSTDSVER
jgi:hypothetical protein